MREPSRPLPSIYSELARTLATASFETWLRLTMANLLSPRSTPVLSYLDTEVPRHTWGLAGQILEVPFDPPSGFTFESSLLTALGISHLLAPTVLPHRNRRYGAAWIVAWQRFLRTHPTADAADLRRIVKRARSTIPDVGQFALTPATAVLVDDAFPRSGVITEAAESARRNLLDMVTSTIALTTHGVDDDRFDRAVNDCLVEIERGPS